MSAAPAALVEARAAASVAPGGARAWILCARPATLSAAAVPVLAGTAIAYAHGAFAPLPAVAALFSAFLIQIGTNFANDVFDFDKGADTAERLGPTRAVQAGLLTRVAVRNGMVACFALALVGGVYLTFVGGPVILVIGILSIASGVAYTGGPFPLGYHGLGDVFVLVFFGLVAVAGTVWVQAGHLPPVTWLAGAGVGAVATAILVVNNVRDRETDVKAGKRTLAVRFGRRFGVIEYAALWCVAYAAVVVAFALELGSALVLLPLATAPLAVSLTRRLAREEGRALNPVLASTARALVLYGGLLSAGLAAA